MNLTIPLMTYNKQYVIFIPPVKNNVIENSQFVRTLYSTPTITFNGLFFDTNSTTISRISKIEEEILKCYPTNKRLVLGIESAFTRMPKPMVKISGIWINETMYGMVYKLMDYPSVLK